MCVGEKVWRTEIKRRKHKEERTRRRERVCGKHVGNEVGEGFGVWSGVDTSR